MHGVKPRRPAPSTIAPSTIALSLAGGGHEHKPN